MKNAKVIGFVNTSDSWGGGEKWHFEAARDLQQRGFNVIFFCSSGGSLQKKLHESNITTEDLEISNLSFLNPLKIIGLARRLRERNITTLLLNNPADLKLVGPTAKLAGIGNIIYRRGMPHPVSRNFFNRWLLRDVVRHVIANSKATADVLQAGKGAGMVPAEKIVVIPNGIEFDSSEHTPLVARDDRLTLSTACRLTKQKNLPHLLEIAAKLRDQDLKFHLLIAGTGELETELRELARELKLESVVSFLGFVENIPGLFASTDIFVFTTSYEGSPNTIIEAAGYGLPIVASDIPPIREILADDSVGRLCPLNDTQKFCDAITELANDQEQRRQTGLAARKVIRQRFDLNQAREQLIALL